MINRKHKLLLSSLVQIHLYTEIPKHHENRALHANLIFSKLTTVFFFLIEDIPMC